MQQQHQQQEQQHQGHAFGLTFGDMPLCGSQLLQQHLERRPAPIANATAELLRMLFPPRLIWFCHSDGRVLDASEMLCPTCGSGSRFAGLRWLARLGLAADHMYLVAAKQVFPCGSFSSIFLVFLRGAAEGR